MIAIDIIDAVALCAIAYGVLFPRTAATVADADAPQAAPRVIPIDSRPPALVARVMDPPPPQPHSVEILRVTPEGYSGTGMFRPEGHPDVSEAIGHPELAVRYPDGRIEGGPGAAV